MKKLLLPFVVFAFLFSACKKNSEDAMLQANQQQASQLSAQPILTTQQTNAFIYQTIQNTGEFNWKDASDFMLYSAIMQSDDHMVSIGFKPVDEKNVDERLSKINIGDSKWAAVKVQVTR